MKTKVLIAIAIMMFAFTATFAKDPETTLRETVRAHIEFPEFTIEQLIEGDVYAEFTVKEDGSIDVLNCFSTQGELQTYVYKELSTIVVNPDPSLIGGTYTMKFEFKLL